MRDPIPEPLSEEFDCSLPRERDIDQLLRLNREVRELRAAAAFNQWRPIATAPRETPIIMGHWFIDPDPKGYHGGNRWLWVASGSIDDDGHWCDFTDNSFRPECFHTATHWMPFDAFEQPNPPVWTQEMIDECKRKGDELYERFKGVEAAPIVP